MWALLPLKRFNQAKQRLAGVLSLDERCGLFTAMVRDVLSVLQSHPDISNTLIVSDDVGAEALAKEYGAVLMPETIPGVLVAKGLNAAVQAGIAELQRRGVSEAMVIHGDLPMIAADEVSHLIRVHRAQGVQAEEGAADVEAGFGVTLAPDVHRTGTNCLICHPASGLMFHYGPNSFAAHMREASQRGSSLQIVIAPGLSRDMDRPQDLLSLADCRNAAIAPHTRDFLRSCGLPERIAAFVAEFGHYPDMPLNRVG